MIEFQKHHLKNGLTVISNYDASSSLVAMNLIYKVGARHENPNLTGFAHLFEHLMFEGSINIPSYDKPLQKAGGHNNAFTNNDITNYYLTVPFTNIETGFWLESDRMLGLDFTEKKLEIQKSVVTEEYNQRYVNQPYGDLWHILRPLAYEKHPYQWPTIGKTIDHVKNAGMTDVKAFFNKHYFPGNAVLSISGNLKPEQVFKLSEKWFGDIPAGVAPKIDIPAEPDQTEARFLTVQRDVPTDSIYIAFHIPERTHRNYICMDMVSDLLSGSKSSRLYTNLVAKLGVFLQIDAFVLGSHDPGLFIIGGKINPNFTVDKAESAIWEEITNLKEVAVKDHELAKIKIKAESSTVFSRVNCLKKAMSLGLAEVLKNAELVNEEIRVYRSIQSHELQMCCEKYLSKSNSSTLHYLKN